jgi:hypothetical protein
VLCQLSYWPVQTALLAFLVIRVRLAEAAELLHVQTLGGLLLVARRAVVATLALAARELNDVSHDRLLYFETAGSEPFGLGLKTQGSESFLTLPALTYSGCILSREP